MTSRRPSGEPRLLRGSRFVVCVNNDGYQASLELNKIYVALPDRDAAHGDLRVVDESGEDYLFSADRFVTIDVPQAVRASIGRASSHASPNNEVHLTSGRSHDRPRARR